MIRVVHYIGLLEFGGSQSFVMEIYRKIDRSKIQFDFVTFPNQKSGYFDEIVKLGGIIYEAPRYSGKNHMQFIKWWDDFFCEHPEYHILHCHVRSVATLVIHAAHKHHVYAIAHSHSTSNGVGLSALVKAILQWPLRYQADYMLSCSAASGRWLFGKHACNQSNYKRIPNAIDAQRFVFNNEKRQELRDYYQISDCFVVGNVGRMVQAKNHIFLLEIFAHFLSMRPNARLLLVGDGELRTSLEKKSEELGIADKVIFAGKQKNVNDFYQAMDVFVFPSLWEGFGMVAIEAQCSGLRCVVSDAIPEEIDMGCGLVERLQLSDSKEIWAKEIYKCPKERMGQVLAIRMRGYDIEANAKWMQDFYLEIGEGCTY